MIQSSCLKHLSLTFRSSLQIRHQWRGRSIDHRDELRWRSFRNGHFRRRRSFLDRHIRCCWSLLNRDWWCCLSSDSRRFGRTKCCYVSATLIHEAKRISLTAMNISCNSAAGSAVNPTSGASSMWIGSTGGYLVAGTVLAASLVGGAAQILI